MNEGKLFKELEKKVPLIIMSFKIYNLSNTFRSIALQKNENHLYNLYF